MTAALTFSVVLMERSKC